MTDATNTPRSSSRRKRRRRFILPVTITFVLVFGWIGVMVGLQMLSGSEGSFRDETVAVLEAMRDRRTAELYREASPLFRERMTVDALTDTAADVDQTLGKFREILTSKIVDEIDGPGGRTRRLATTLAFERAKTSGHFSFHWVDGRWRLLGFGISIPAALAPASDEDAAAASSARSQAPSRVLAQFREILEIGREGGAAQIHAEAAPPFQAAIDAARFAKLLEEREHLLGRYVDITSIQSATQNRARSKAWITALVRFTKVETTVRMTFIKLDGVWRLSYYKVAIPLPSVPDIDTDLP